MLNVRQNLISFVLTCTLLFSITPPLYAASNSSQSSGHTIYLPIVSTSTNEISDVDSFEKVAIQMEQYMSIAPDGTLQLEHIQASSFNGEDAEMYKILIEALAYTNKLLQSGELSLSDISFMSEDESENDYEVQAAGCSGKNRTRYRWWGYKKWLNSCNTNRLMGALTATGGLAGGCTAVSASTIYGLPVAGVCLAIASGSGVGVGTILWYSAEGDGIILYMAWPSIPFRVRSQ